MDLGLGNKIVLVTGASGGIGGELVRMFLGEGAKVAAHYHRHRERAEAVIEGQSDNAIVVGGDLSKEDEVSNVYGEIESKLGPVEVTVANAGFWPPTDASIHDMTLDQWNSTLATNLTSVFLCMREFFRGIIKHKLVEPSAVLIGSTAGMIGEAGHVDYAATKAALTYGFANSLKNEIARVAPRGRINVVCPGWTATPLVDRFTSNEDNVRRVLQTISLRKVGRPSDVGGAVLYLSSPVLAGHVTGQVITVGGGMEGRVLYSSDEVDPANA